MAIKKVFVLGAGIMGTGIAHLCAQQGLDVALVDIDEGILKRSIGNIEGILNKRVDKGKMTAEAAKELVGRIKISTDKKEAANCDFVIEAVTENISLKQKLFTELDEIVPPQIILATNTTACSISEVASATKDPSRVIGMHYFNPAVVMKLVEIMPGLATRKDVAETTEAFVRSLGKEPVVTAKEGIAGIASRVLAGMLNEAVWVLEEGIGTAADIDKAMKMGSNLPMGPLALIDMIGIDTHLAKTRNLYAKLGDARYRPCYLLEKMMHAGYLGRKSGKGFYDYSQDPPVPTELR